jgi:hypothetical protein
MFIREKLERDLERIIAKWCGIEMDEANFESLLEKLQGYPVIWNSDSPKFTLSDLQEMTRSQLSTLALEMITWTGAGSISTSPELFDLINYLDETVEIPEDHYLENYLHLTASLTCLAQFHWPAHGIPAVPERLARHLKRIIGPSRSAGIERELDFDLNKAFPSLQIATFLAYPLLEGVIRRKLSQFISPKGRVLDEFQVLERSKIYKRGDRINNLDHELQLLETKSASPSLRAKLSKLSYLWKENAKPSQQVEVWTIQSWRWRLLHGALPSSFHALTILLLTYIILLEE